MSSILTILLVDDDEQLGEVLQYALVKAGYNVLRVCNGYEALQVYDPRTVDLVLTDLIMPRLEGVELILRLKKLNPDLNIVAMSGGGRNEPSTYLEIVRHLGVTHTLIKPFTCEELVKVIRQALARENNPCESR